MEMAGDSSDTQASAPARATILLVDDEKDITDVMKMRLELLGYKVIESNDPMEALELFKKSSDIDLLLTDQRMDNLSGQELMEKCLEHDPYLQTIIFTAYGTIDQAVDAIKAGAFSYVTKPVDHKELEVKIQQAIEKRNLLKKVHDFESMMEGANKFADLIGKSPKMKAIFRQILQIAPTDITISITGESGTGKELAARAIHLHSKRSQGPFVAINCAAVPESMLEDELFGHVKGAFTSAVGTKNGVFMSAHEGTLFLDEIGEMDESMQVKLLRVLETGEVKPLGSDTVRKVDVRLVVATNKDLKQLVDEGRFRQDLYYRVQVAPIAMPPLRERKEDIPLLLGHFLEKAARKMDKDIKWVEEDVIHAFCRYDWPGNVRELENIVNFLVAISQKEVITADLLASTQLAAMLDASKLPSLKDARFDFTKRYLEDIMRHTRGNVSMAAKHAGYYRADFYKLLQKHGLDPDTFRKKSRKISTRELEQY